MRTFKYGDLRGKSIIPRKTGVARAPSQLESKSHRKVASESRYGIEKSEGNLSETLQIAAVRTVQEEAKPRDPIND